MGSVGRPACPSDPLLWTHPAHVNQRVIAQAQQGIGAVPRRDKTRPARTVPGRFGIKLPLHTPSHRMCGTKLALLAQNGPIWLVLPAQGELSTAVATNKPRRANFFTLTPTPGRARRTFSHQHPNHTPDSGLTYAIAASLANTHPLPNTVVPKTRTTSPTTARFQRFSPRQSALWAPHHPGPRSHHHQTGGIALHEAPTRRRHTAGELHVAQNPHHARLTTVTRDTNPDAAYTERARGADLGLCG